MIYYLCSNGSLCATAGMTEAEIVAMLATTGLTAQFLTADQYNLALAATLKAN